MSPRDLTLAALALLAVYGAAYTLACLVLGGEVAR